MAMSVGTSRGGTIADINVTPMADVMIVLLIIFMVATPFIAQDSVKLPAASNGGEDKGAKPMIIVLQADGALRVDETPLGSYKAALGTVTDLTQSVAGRPLWIKADRGVPYAWVRSVLEACRRGGAEEVHFATTTPEVRG
jgi:biopolymer transport protein ExbD